MTIDEAINNYADGQGSRVDILVPLLMATIGHVGHKIMSSQEAGEEAAALTAAEMSMFTCISAIEKRDPALLQEVEALSLASMQARQDEEATD